MSSHEFDLHATNRHGVQALKHTYVDSGTNGMGSEVNGGDTRGRERHRDRESKESKEKHRETKEKTGDVHNDEKHFEAAKEREKRSGAGSSRRFPSLGKLSRLPISFSLMFNC